MTQIYNSLAGVELGWHGSVDILLEDNLPVKLMKDTDDSFENMDSSIETKSNEIITEDDYSQLLAQTIVFSFLQNRRNRFKLNNSLIPGIGISSQNFYINMYDSVNDVLLSTHSLGLFGVGKPLVDKVVLLWLTLNYRYFCTGVTEEMLNCKSEFHRRLDDMLPEYTHNVIRPLHIPQQTNTQDKLNWYDGPGRKVKRSSETNEYYTLQKSIT